MIVLNSTDTLEGGASVDAKIDYVVSGLVSGVFTKIASGQLSSTNPSVLYTAASAIAIVSITFVNTHTSAVTCDLYIDNTNAGTPRRLIPKALSLQAGYSMVFDGGRFMVQDTAGGIVSGANVSDEAYDAGWDGVTSVAPSKNAVYDGLAPKANPVFTGTVETPAIKITTGAGLAKVLTSDADGDASWETASAGSVDLANNLKPVVNAAVNKLDIFTKTGGAVPDATNYFTISIPDGNGYTARTRKATYLSGTSQFIMADGANYWGKGSLNADIKNAYIYAIWDGTGIVWALGGYSGLTVVSTTTTVTDPHYLLPEEGSTYTRSASHYCICCGRIRYEYDTADTPDHTIQATVANAPQIIYGRDPSDMYYKTQTYGSAISLDVSTDVAWVDVDATNAAITFIPPRTTNYKITFEFTPYCYSEVATQVLWQENWGIHDGAAVVEEAHYTVAIPALASSARGYVATHMNLSTPAKLVGGTSYTYKLQHQVIANTGIVGAQLNKPANYALRMIVEEIGGM